MNATPAPKVTPINVKNCSGINSIIGKNARQTMALITIIVLNFIMIDLIINTSESEIFVINILIINTDR